MSKTIFCTFDNLDEAEIAMGQLRSSVAGVQSIQYTRVQRGHRQTQHEPGDDASLADVGGFWPVGAFTSSTMQPIPVTFTPLTAASSEPISGGPITVKIVCDRSAHKKVVAKLVNLHAQKIVAIS